MKSSHYIQLQHGFVFKLNLETAIIKHWWIYLSFQCKRYALEVSKFKYIGA